MSLPTLSSTPHLPGLRRAAELLLRRLLHLGRDVLGHARQRIPVAGAFCDADGDRPLGERSYTLHLPAGVPAAHYWSLVVYDAATRCLLNNGAGFASIASNQNLTLNDDGSADPHFGPQPPATGTGNWIETVPGRGWFGALRLYGPTQAFFDRAWTRGDLTKVTSSARPGQ